MLLKPNKPCSSPEKQNEADGAFRLDAKLTMMRQLRASPWFGSVVGRTLREIPRVNMSSADDHFFGLFSAANLSDGVCKPAHGPGVNLFETSSETRGFTPSVVANL